jgi:hypothetical protein
MANKKISQLTSMGTEGIGTADYFVITESVGGGNYATVKTTPDQVANYVLNPVTADQISGYNKNYFFNNVDSQGFSSWTKAGSNTLNFPYLQVDLNNGGKLVTGSGISVPAIGDDMGDCVATTHLDMTQYDIINANIIYFDGDDSTSDTFIKNGGTTNLTVKAENDLILSGQRHVSISGQALSLENGDTQTPILGNVTITGGNLEIDPGNKLIVNQISGYNVAYGGDSALLTIEGASTHVPFSDGSTEVDWSNSNIQYKTRADGASEEYDFHQVADGQTLTLYYQNTHNSTPITPKFTSGTYGPDTAGAVRWGAEYGNEAPVIAANKTNLYTFVRINTGIFASAVTGYVY